MDIRRGALDGLSTSGVPDQCPGPRIGVYLNSHEDELCAQGCTLCMLSHSEQTSTRKSPTDLNIIHITHLTTVQLLQDCHLAAVWTVIDGRILGVVMGLGGQKQKRKQGIGASDIMTRAGKDRGRGARCLGSGVKGRIPSPSFSFTAL